MSKIKESSRKMGKGRAQSWGSGVYCFCLLWMFDYAAPSLFLLCRGGGHVPHDSFTKPENGIPTQSNGVAQALSSLTAGTACHLGPNRWQCFPQRKMVLMPKCWWYYQSHMLAPETHCNSIKRCLWELIQHVGSIPPNGIDALNERKKNKQTNAMGM